MIATQFWTFVWQVFAMMGGVPPIMKSRHRLYMSASGARDSAKDLETSFLASVKENNRMLQSVCWLNANTREDREDLWQEIMIQLWSKYSTFEGKSSIASWMYRIAIRTAQARFKRRESIIEFYTNAPEQSSGEHTDQGISDRLFKIFMRLNIEERAMLSLVAEGYTFEETGAILGLTETVLNKRIQRLRIILNNN